VFSVKPLEKALLALHEAIERSKKEADDEMVRDATIQRFEYCYELSWRLLKRRIELDAATKSDIDSLSFKGLIREGAERGYILNPEAWFKYRECRNLTSYTYNEINANIVYQASLPFYDDAMALLKKLQVSA